jgi:hypothetical protein
VEAAEQSISYARKIGAEGDTQLRRQPPQVLVPAQPQPQPQLRLI